MPATVDRTRPAPPTAHAGVLIDSAALDDVAALLRLYRTVYGDAYPLRLGTDPAAMATALTDAAVQWWVARDVATGDVVGSGLLRTDPVTRIGKVEGIVVHPDRAGEGIAGLLLEALVASAFGPEGQLESVYATARCVSPAPQRMLMRHGFQPMGLLPGAIRLCETETLALLVRYRDGLPANRKALDRVPKEVAALLEAARSHGSGFDFTDVHPKPSPACAPSRTGTGLEVNQDAALVRQRYAQVHADGAGVLPLHQPNTLLASPDGGSETFAVIDPTAGSGLLLGGPASPDAPEGMLGDVIQAMTERGATYIEAVLPLHDHEQIEQHLAHGFVPSAVYPAMRLEGGVWHDYVVLSRTTDRPDVRSLCVDDRFAPYLEQHGRS
ncbi:GNAT family N-acetyltransferase [Streptomyces sp. E11-3]|uniref:GNAT family N-acetyltransferase n=1 Tax=Streptomyces sp. E11-3 TaxID=3110112 RepID=UPI00397F3277